AAVSLSSPPASNLATQILIRLRPIPWRLARACSDSPPRNSWTTWRLNSIECVRCLAMGFLLESPVQLADSHLPHLSTPRGALHMVTEFCPTEAARVGQNSLKDRPKVAWRTGDRAEYLGGRRLLLQRLGRMPPHLGELTGARFELLFQLAQRIEP